MIPKSLRVESVLVIADRELRLLRHHAEREYPKECCGILLGRPSGGESRVTRALPTVNQRGSEASSRFEIPPEALLRAMRLEEQSGEVILGYYHSHPDREAVPSSLDVSSAWPDTSYVIVEVLEGRAAAVRSWRRVDAGMVEERIPQGARLEEPAGG